jgi:DNA mismatch repair ATPase MutS
LSDSRDSSAASFGARGLGHPLIPDAACVRNDVLLNSDNRFYLVSGSNMAVKSTSLRSIILNVVLAEAGAPVRAVSSRLSGLDVFASLSIADSILEGKSKFLTEVERVKQMLESAAGGPTDFDYLLKPGITTENNVLAIVVMMGSRD